jgi:hypothetical protein
LRWIAAAAAVLAVALALPVSPGAARSAAACAAPGYTYAGYASAAGARRVAATVAAARLPDVASGHVAAWVGVGAPHAGPSRSNEWLQVGVAAYPGSGLRLYEELVRPGARRAYVELGRATPGAHHRLAVVQRASAVWQATIDGRPAGPAVSLPGTEHGLRSVAAAESWTQGRTACNGYAFEFRGVRLGDHRRVRLSAPVNRLRDARAGFDATA